MSGKIKKFKKVKICKEDDNKTILCFKNVSEN
jgi:hypothetical protein